jgi:serine/threonine protein kinase/cytochrome c-type biogenesis protein CcmH/NrfG
MFEKNSKTDCVPPKEMGVGGNPFPPYPRPTSKAAAIDPLAATRVSPALPPVPLENSTGENDEKIIDGRYRLGEKLGEGGMGTVYRAKHTLMDKTVAIKVIHPDLTHSDEVAKRFEREAKSASRLTDPHCINVTDFGRTKNGELFLVMEYLEGETLADRLREKSPLPLEKAIQIARQILKALAHAHGAGVVHRDLKPDNVMLVTHGDNADFVKVFDFGVAKLLTNTDGIDVAKTSDFRAAKSPSTDDRMENLTQAGLVLGTPAYLAPEQGRGKAIDHRADLYAVGVILFEMLAGLRPFRGSSAFDIVLAHLNEPIPTLPKTCNAPRAIHAIIKKSLAKNPQDRFDSAEQFIAALDGIGSPLGQVRLSSVFPERLFYRVHRTSAQFLSRRLQGISSFVRLMTEHLEAVSPSRVFRPIKGGMVTMTPPRKRLILAGALVLFLLFGFLTIAIWQMRESPRFYSINATHIVDLRKGSNEELGRLLEDTHSHLQAGDAKRASSAARRALRLSPDQAVAHFLLGHALHLRGDQLGATKSYAQALELDRSLAEDRLLREHLKEALSHEKPRSNAASLLAQYAGKEGIEILASLANSSLASQEERAAARQALLDTHNEASIDWVASLGADFQHYDSCSKKREILAQMGETGDLAFLPFLENEVRKLTQAQPGLPSDDSQPGIAKFREGKQPQCAIEEDMSRTYRALKGKNAKTP